MRSLVANPDFAQGLSTSLKAGIAAVPAGCDGALVLLGDMPQIEACDLDRLIEAFAPGAIVVPVHEGRQGNPVLWARSPFPGDHAARRRRGRQAADRGASRRRCARSSMGTARIFADVDTPEELQRLREMGRG